MTGKSERVRVEQLLNEYDLACVYQVSVGTVRKWRYKGLGPRYIKLGGSVRYRPEDVRAYLSASPTGGGGDDRTLPNDSARVPKESTE